MPPSVGFLNQTAPFWDFVASLEDQASSHPFFSADMNQAREGDREGESWEFPWGSRGSGFGHRGGHGFGGRGGRDGHEHGMRGPGGPPPPFEEGGFEGHEHDHGHRHGKGCGRHHGGPERGPHGKGPAIETPSDSGTEAEAIGQEIELPIRGAGTPPPPGEGMDECCHGKGRASHPPHEHQHRRGNGRPRSHSPPRQGRFGPHHGPRHHGPPHHGPPHHGPPHHGPSHHGPSHHGPPHHGPSHHDPSHHGPPHGGPHGHRGRHGLEGLMGALGCLGVSGGPFAELYQAQMFGNGEKKATNEDFVPPVDIFDTETAYIVHVSLAGAKKENVAVNWDAENSDLIVSGVIARDGDEEFLKTLSLGERSIGAFERKVKLGSRIHPAKVEASGITAKMEDGVLKIEITKEDKEDFVNVMKVEIE